MLSRDLSKANIYSVSLFIFFSNDLWDDLWENCETATGMYKLCTNYVFSTKIGRNGEWFGLEELKWQTESSEIISRRFVHGEEKVWERKYIARGKSVAESGDVAGTRIKA